MNRLAWGIVAVFAFAVVVTCLWLDRDRSTAPRRNGSKEPPNAALPGQFTNDAARNAERPASPNQAEPQPLDSKTPHPLLGEADQAVLADGRDDVRSTAGPELAETMRRVIRLAGEAREPAALVIDYPLDKTIFPPEIVPPTFLWHEPSAAADTWLVDVAFADQSPPIHILSRGDPPAAGPIDPACIAESNEIYKPTPYQASSRNWTPGGEVWKVIKQRATGLAASVSIAGFRSAQPAEILSRGRITLTSSTDPVGAPIFYRDVPLAPSLTEKGVIKPLADEAIALIGWRLRDISKAQSRLLMDGVPTCTNCHSFSADGKTLGMDLDGPGGDKGAYVIAPVRRETKFELQNVISWNSFPDKPQGQKTIGFLSQISPDGEFAVTTLNESVYVCNFMDYQFLQVFFPTRGILACYNRSTGEIKTLPGADDPKYVHCDAVWTPDGSQLVFARAEAKDPYPKDEKLAARANDPAETQIQYDLYRIPFQGGRGGRPEPIAGASNNGMSNTFPKVSPDGKWIVFVKCRNGQLMRPDSTLWIVSAAGGTARRMTCNTSRMNSWHSFSPNGRWLVFSSKSNTPYTQMFLAHIDTDGSDSPAVLVPDSTAANRAVNIPEFINLPYDDLVRIDVPALDYYRHAVRGVQLRKEGRFDEAVAEFEAAIKLQPDFKNAYTEAAVALVLKGKLDEAMDWLNKTLKLDPNDSGAHCTAGTALLLAGRLDEAVARLERALEINPYYRTAHAILGKVYLDQGKPDQATPHLRTAVELDEKDPLGHFDLGRALLQRKMLAEASEEFKRTIDLDPHAVDARLMLSQALSAQGDFRSAAAQLREATTADPNDLRPLADLAWLLATCPQDDVRNGVKAVELAEQVCAVTGYKDPLLLNTLAAAYAETGDFSRAVATATKALGLAGSLENSQVQWIRQNLEHFQAAKPYRLPLGIGAGLKGP